jgi:eukaryotic-like serine/threonine-protein kinase
VTAVPVSLANALRDRYRLERELGSGGMATVYLAEDLKHHREVAVKVLRPELAASVGAERFLQEITTAARFQHPHILPLLDSGDASGFLYYVMPYVEGESLRRRLSRQGELPVHDAVKILVEVCDALTYAHARGVVHRDIKPDNVLLSGRHALVTDFGVAKALSEATGRQQLTTAGVALGTPAYMAPEQAAGESNIDQRVDIYALGILGYELVSGRVPFTGRTSQEVLAMHVTQPPEPLCLRRPACPPGLESVIMKCLAKRPADRWQTADELLAQLEPIATPSGGTTPTATRPVSKVAPAARRAIPGRWIAVAALLLVIAGAVALALTRNPPEARLGRRLQLTLSPGLEIDPALSPDGKLVAYVAGPVFATRLYVRQVEGGTPFAITPEGRGFARMPRWSPDGERLVFSSDRGLEVIPALGGVARLLVTLSPNSWLDGTWSPDGRAIAYGSGDSVVVRPVDGGASRGVGRLVEANSCTWSPDGRWIACVSGNRQFVSNEDYGNIATSSVWVVPAAGGAPVRVTDETSHNTSPAWLPGKSSLMFVSNRDGGRDLYQVTLTRAGRPTDDVVRLSTGLNPSTVSVSANGRRLAYATFSRTANIWSIPISSEGSVSSSTAKPVTTGSQEIEGFDVSADEGWLVFDSNRSGTQQIYRMPLPSGNVEQLTSGDAPSLAPAVSPDGRDVAYHTFINGIRQIFVMPVEGGTPVQVTTGSTHSRIANWSPDGRALTFTKDALSPAQGTGIVSRDGQGHWGSPRTLIKGGGSGVWSPDGRGVLTAVQVDRDRTSLVIEPAAGGAPRMLIPPQERFFSAGLNWGFSADSRLVYYTAEEPETKRGGIWRVPATGGPRRLVVSFDGAAASGLSRSTLRVGKSSFYFSIGDPQSDVWMTELSVAR